LGNKWVTTRIIKKIFSVIELRGTYYTIMMNNLTFGSNLVRTYTVLL